MSRKARSFRKTQWLGSSLIAAALVGTPASAAPDSERMAEVREAAVAGHPEAQFMLGRSLAESDPVASFEWILRAAEAGLADAEEALGFRYLEGRGVDADEAEAARWLRRAAEKGERLAQWQLAEMSCRGLCSEADEEKAIRWFRAVATHEDSPLAELVPGAIGDVYWRRARRYELGAGVAVDPVAVYLWDAVAVLTDPERGTVTLESSTERLTAVQRLDAAARLRAWAAENGVALAADATPLATLTAAERRHRELRAPAENGDAEAQFLLAQRLASGDGVGRDPAEAVEWYRRAAEQGHGEAAYELHFCYALGRGVEENDALAQHWKLRAAEAGFARAQVQVGMELQFGFGEIDDRKAVGWYRRAAEQGDAKGQYALALSYAEGKGIGKDDAEAVRWYRLAAQQDLTHGQLELGTHLAHGRGVARNPVEAAFWLGLASRKDVEGEPGLREVTFGALSPAQRAGVETRIETWLAERQAAEEAAAASEGDPAP